jgi:hypothetical protein
MPKYILLHRALFIVVIVSRCILESRMLGV